MEHLKSIILMEAYLTNPEENLMSMEMILGLMLKEDLTLSLEINLDTTTQSREKFLMILIEIVFKDS